MSITRKVVLRRRVMTKNNTDTSNHKYNINPISNNTLITMNNTTNHDATLQTSYTNQ